VRHPKIVLLLGAPLLLLEKSNSEMTIPNHFAALLDPVGILGTCAQSGALDALPVSAKRSADRMSPKVVGELAEHDAAVDDLYRQLIVKAAKTSSAKPREVLHCQEEA
jgi:hypothetical protein